MKKLLFTLAVIAMPLTAQAEVQYAPEKMPEETIKAAIKDFADPWCETGGYKGLIQNVSQCYKTTSANSPDIDKCLLGDTLLRYITQILRKQSEELGEDDQTGGIKFVLPQSFHKRALLFLNTPRYSKMTQNQQANYFSPNIIYRMDEVIMANNKKCPAH